MSDLFGGVHLFGTPMGSLGLETRGRTPIRNTVGLDAVAWGQQQKFAGMVRTFGWVVRRPPTGMYNCAGHVWASRRTGLYETSDYETILNEDGYRTLRENELPRPGDLVLYRLEGTDEILHVGEIVEMCSLVPGGAPSIPRVLSKVDATSGEVLHAVENVPYDIVGGAPGGPPGRLRCRCEYRTDRPWEETR
jgi:hypothetical protein